MKLIFRKRTPKIYCLKVVVAHPDKDLPGVDVIISHFSSLEQAQAKLEEIEENYIDSIEIDRATFESPDKLERYVYNEAAMDIPPFAAEIFRVRPQ